MRLAALLYIYRVSQTNHGKRRVTESTLKTVDRTFCKDKLLPPYELVFEFTVRSCLAQPTSWLRRTADLESLPPVVILASTQYDGDDATGIYELEKFTTVAGSGRYY